MENSKLEFLNESEFSEYQLIDQMKIAHRNQEQTTIN